MNDDAGCRRAELRATILRERGYVGPFHEGMLRLDPDWLERYLAFVSAPANAGRVPPKLVHLIYAAIDAVPSHLYPRGIGIHLGLAQKHGATTAELIETLEIAVSLTGLTIETGMPILAEELHAAGLPMPPLADGVAEELVHRYASFAGTSPEWLEPAARLAPDSLGAMLDLMALPWEKGSLPARDRALIAIACHASPAVVNGPGIRRHVREALQAGAGAAEIADVLFLASGIGIHAISVGAPILIERIDSTAPRPA